MDYLKNHEAEDYHVFVTDSVWMKELGLSTFTTGTLYDWWYHRGPGGKFINRPLVLKGASDVVPDVFFGSGGHPCVEGNTQPWRFVGSNKGKYDPKTFDHTWTYADGRPKTDKKPWYGNEYTHSDIKLDFFDGSKWVPSFEWASGTTVGLLAPQRLANSGAPGDAGLCSVSNIVAMNDWVRDRLLKYPEVSGWDTEAQARHRFIEDIKTSKSGCLIYPVRVEFNVAPGQLFVDDTGALVPALKTEDFNIKLYLYDERMERKTGRTAILSATKHAAVPKDATGRIGNREDGEISEVDNDPANKVVGDVDMHMNHMTGKWQSGSKQILAKITQRVPSATWEATVEDLDEQDNQEILNLPDDPKHLVLGSGAAMPISMQNGNPMQWTPNYANPKSCRKDKKEKATVLVYNPDPGRTWEKDKVVLLNEIDGLWMPLEFGSGVPSDQAVIEPVFEGRWDFTYSATSLEFFFRDSNNARITPQMAEKAFHVQYYSGAVPNLNFHTTPSLSPHAYTKNILPIYVVPGYHQFTSFDFMDSGVGGTRGEKRSLGATVYGKDPLGNAITDPPSTTSGPFFGCVFPNGYKTSDDEGKRTGADDYVSARAWDVSAKQDGTYIYFNNIPKDTIAIDSHEVGSAESLKRHAYSESPTVEYGPVIVGPMGNAARDSAVVPMFAATYDGDYSVAHLPADIATNSSPSGSYGRPLTSLKNIGAYCHSSLFGSALQVGMRNLFFYDHKDPLGVSAYSWLYKQKYTDGDTVSHDATLGGAYAGAGAADDSAFDFQPITANKIQFRPLKIETYASLVQKHLKGNYTAKGDRRGDMWHFVRGKMNDGEAPASIVSRDREKFAGFTTHNPLYVNGATDWHVNGQPGYGLGFNVDYPTALFQSNDPSEHFSIAWNDYFNGWMVDEPAGAVGVIGAICTVSAGPMINFTTHQTIGMGSDFLRPPSVWGTTWGGPSLKYNDFHTTDLSVRIYHAWPRSQTIYDPRFFAVHHFNNGVTLDDTITRGAQDTNGSNVPDHNIAIADSTVDIREPTYVTESGQDSVTIDLPIPIGVGGQVFGDAVHFGGAAHPLLSSSQWDINPVRRGKLLPFNYVYKRVAPWWDQGYKIVITEETGTAQTAGVYHSGGLPQTSNVNDKFVDSPHIAGVGTLEPHHASMIVQNLGSGYTVGDKFTINGSDCTLKVTKVMDLGAYKGSIGEFEFISSGTYFDHTKLFKLTNEHGLSDITKINQIKSFTQGTATIKPKTSESVAGKGFSAYMASAQVKEMGSTDAKPQIATVGIDYHQLSLGAPNYPKEHETKKPMLQGERIVQALLDNPSTEGKYDLFFHCHNDVSHTFMGRSDWHEGIHNNEDQYIDLTIVPV